MPVIVNSILMFFSGRTSSTSIFVRNGGSSTAAVVKNDKNRQSTRTLICGFRYLYTLPAIFFFDWQWMHSAPARKSVLPHFGQTFLIFSYVAATISYSAARSAPSCICSTNVATQSQSAASEYVKRNTGNVLPFTVNFKTALPYILFTTAFSTSMCEYTAAPFSKEESMTIVRLFVTASTVSQ